MSDIKSIKGRRKAFLDKFNDRCVDRAEYLRISHIPESSDQWTMPVSLEEYNEALEIGLSAIGSVRLIVQSQSATLPIHESCSKCGGNDLRLRYVEPRGDDIECMSHRCKTCDHVWQGLTKDQKDDGLAIGDNSTIMNGRNGHPMFQEAIDAYINTRYNQKGKAT